MQHNQQTPVEPIKSSSSEFVILYQNHFVVLDDAKHIIGADADDLSKMILENVDNGSKVEFGGSIICFSEITSLVYNEDTRSLYSADSVGDLLKYKINTAGKTCEKVRIYLNFGKDGITSSHRFMHFVFLDGVRVKSRSWTCQPMSFFRGICKHRLGIFHLSKCV